MHIIYEYMNIQRFLGHKVKFSAINASEIVTKNYKFQNLSFQTIMENIVNIKNKKKLYKLYIKQT